jgi:hypothetical protein
VIDEGEENGGSKRAPNIGTQAHTEGKEGKGVQCVEGKKCLSSGFAGKTSAEPLKACQRQSERSREAIKKQRAGE